MSSCSSDLSDLFLDTFPTQRYDKFKVPEEAVTGTTLSLIILPNPLSLAKSSRRQKDRTKTLGSRHFHL